MQISTLLSNRAFYKSIFNHIIMIKSHGIAMAFFIIKGGKTMENGDLKGG